MTAAFIPLAPIDPVLTEAQEAQFWAIWDALQAAEASGDERLIGEANGLFLDWQLSVGLLTRAQFRELAAPYLLDVIARADEIPEGRDMLQRIRDYSLEAVNGPDYAESAAGALFILYVDGVQNPRRAKTQNAKSLTERTLFIRNLRSIETRSDLACLLLHAHAFAPEYARSPDRHNAQEAWSAARGAWSRARELLKKMRQPVGGEYHHHKRGLGGGE